MSHPLLDGHDAALEQQRAVQPTARRDPAAATGRIHYQTPGAPMVAEWDADTAIRWGYYANVIAYRCIDLRSRIISSLPFRAGRDQPDRPGEAADHNPSARLAQLLGPPPNGPAKRLTARKLWRWTKRQELVTGRWAWEVETVEPSGKGAISALWPLVSGSLRPIPTKSGEDWFSGFRYGPYAEEKKLAPDQVVYGWHPMMTDFRQPESPFQAARLDTSIAVMGDRYSYAFLKNGMVASHVVTTTPFPTEQAKDAFQSQFRAMHAGPDASGSVIFNEVGDDGDGPVGEAISIQTIATSQKDARFVEQHQASLERVAMAFGVPWSLLDASGRTFDNAGQEWLTFWTLTGLDDLRDLADEINVQLAPRLGGEVGWFDTSGVRVLQQKPEPLSAKVGAPSLVQAQLMTINEARADYGLPPAEDGDRVMTVAEITALKGAAGPPAVERGAPGDHNQSRSYSNSADRGAPSEPPAEHEDRALTPEEHEQRRAAIWRATDATVRGLEASFEKRMRRLFSRQAKATLSRLEGNRGHRAAAVPVDPSSIFDREFWIGETGDMAAEVFEQIFAAGGARVASQFGLAFDLQAPYAAEFIEARANQLAGNVTTTTYEQITAALAEGAAEGESIPDLAARVTHVFDVASDARATTIARTETISAYNGSGSAVAASYGDDVVAGQEWISTVDGRTRPEHAGADGQVVAIGAAFDVGGEEMAYPGDPGGSSGNVVNCRCTVAFLTPEEMLERGHRPVSRRMSMDAGARVLELVARVRGDAA